MGEMSEYHALDHPFDARDDDPDPFLYWTTNDGRTIAIAAMSHEHLINCVLMLERKLMTDHPSYAPMIVELNNRGKKLATIWARLKQTVKISTRRNK